MTTENDVVEQFKAMKAALESERARLYDSRKVIDDRIREITSLLSNKTEPKYYKPNGTSDLVRAMFEGNHERTITFEEVTELLEGSRNRAGAAIQGLMKSKQLVRSGRGKYRASSRLIEKINGGALPKA